MKHFYFEVLLQHNNIKNSLKGEKELTTNRWTALLLNLHERAFNIKYQQGKNIFVSDALSMLLIETKKDVQDVTPLNFYNILTQCISIILIANLHKM